VEPSDCLVKMYNKRFNIWDEDKLDIIQKSDSYSSSSKYGSISHSAEDKPLGYNESKYGSEKGGAGSVYNSNKGNLDEENKDKKVEEDGTLSNLVSNESKREEKQREDDIIVKAAGHVFAESKNDNKIGSEDSKISSKKTIEEAINQAIKEEKEVIVLS